jgi:hypothetical protein
MSVDTKAIRGRHIAVRIAEDVGRAIRCEATHAGPPILRRRRLRSTTLTQLRSTNVDGKQYVATTSGAVSGFVGGHGTSATIVFALY